MKNLLIIIVFFAILNFKAYSQTQLRSWLGLSSMNEISGGLNIKPSQNCSFDFEVGYTLPLTDSMEYKTLSPFDILNRRGLLFRTGINFFDTYKQSISLKIEYQNLTSNTFYILDYNNGLLSGDYYSFYQKNINWGLILSIFQQLEHRRKLYLELNFGARKRFIERHYLRTGSRTSAFYPVQTTYPYFKIESFQDIVPCISVGIKYYIYN